jgi:peptide-methionine (S)-S-oxide reductase
LLDVFWNCHDPTQVNRQGPDVGLQYRSVIFCHSVEQRAVAEESKIALDYCGALNRPVVTTIEDAPEFWRAEDYHQKYLEKRGVAFCHV